MTAGEILAELRARGVRVEPRAHGGVRRIPARLIDQSLLALIHTNKAALLAHVRAEPEHLEARQRRESVERAQKRARRCCRCGYREHDMERIFCKACGEELSQAPQAEADGAVHADQEERETDRIAAADGWKPDPPAGHRAYSVLQICRANGVALRIDTAGDLVVGCAGAKANEPTQPWPSLLVAIESHLEAVARLVEAGWHLCSDFPKTEAV